MSDMIHGNVCARRQIKEEVLEVSCLAKNKQEHKLTFGTLLKIKH